MGYLETTADLIKDALAKSGEKPDNTSPHYADVVKYLNLIHEKILSGGNEFDTNLAEPWSWAKARYPAALILEPAFTDGSIALTQDSSAGVFSSAPVTSQEGKWLKVGDRPEYYRIAQHTAGLAAFTLDSAYADDTGTGLSFKAIKLEYELDAANILRQIGPMRTQRSQCVDNNKEGQIESLDNKSFNERFPFKDLQEDVPTHFTIIFSSQNSSSRKIIVRFNKYPKIKMRVEYDYIEVPADLTDDANSIPLVPRNQREVLCFCVAHKVLVDKEDSKADYYLKAAKSGLQGMVNENRKTYTQPSTSAGQFYPRPSQAVPPTWPVSGK
jgi:hypothetical protein